MATVVPLPLICELHVARRQGSLPRVTSQVIGHAGAPSRTRSSSATQPCSSGIDRGPDRLQAVGYVVVVDQSSEAVDQRRCAVGTRPGPWPA
jgi:hypothetical protein